MFLGGVSPYQFVFLSLMLLVFLKISITRRVIIKFELFDFLFVIYLIVITVSYLKLQLHAPLLKTYSYFIFYIVVKISMQNLNYDRVRVAIESAAILSSATLISFFLYTVSTMSIAGFDYFSLTVSVFNQMVSNFGGHDLASKDLMRNYLGEIFIFFFIVTVYAKRRFIRVLSVIPALFVFISFSRRAFVSLVLTLALLGFNRFGKLITIIFFFLLTVLVASIFYGIEYRFLDFSDPARLKQYQEVIGYINSSPLFGHGFGAKLESEAYVHNAILANWYMNGIVGLILVMAIYVYFIKKVWDHVIEGNYYLASLLFIPIIGMSIGSTVEGFFTPVAWFVLAYYFSLRRGLLEK